MNRGTLPVPWWRSDRDYYPKGDPRRAAHLKHIEVQEKINARICASAVDGSYSVILRREDMP